MNRTSRDNPVTDRLTALADPVRLRAMRVLERQELSVGELAGVLQLPQSTVSRQLRTLGEAGAGGWLIKRSEGTSTLFRLVLDDLAPPARALWMTVREQLGETAELAEDARRLTTVLAERRTDTRAFFGRVAGEWDSVRNALFGERATLQSLLPLIPRDWIVADLGCGTGNAAEVLAPCVKRVIAVDQSPQMISAARKRLAAYGNVEFVRGELEALPLRTGSVNAAASVLVLHHVPDPVKAVREMARILRPGGTALIVDMIEHDRLAYRQTMGHRWLGFGLPQMIRMLTDCGLRDPHLQTLPSEAAARGPGLFACTAYKP
ncbi:MAG: ArsR/SmtB family transcription factor [Phycisphaerales bacterium]